MTESAFFAALLQPWGYLLFRHSFTASARDKTEKVKVTALNHRPGRKARATVFKILTSASSIISIDIDLTSKNVIMVAGRSFFLPAEPYRDSFIN